MKRANHDPPIHASKRKRTPKSTKQSDHLTWPDHFNQLYKVFKAVNTVLGFVSSRKQLATTFSVVRSSVEALLKQPLDLDLVAELKTLLPEIIKFAYIPRNDLRIHDGGDKSPSFSLPSTSTSSSTMDTMLENEEHVLVLEFTDPSRGKKNTGPALSAPPAMTPSAVKKLIESRNQRFCQAVDELLRTTPPDGDPRSVLQNAARSHVPVMPQSKLGRTVHSPDRHTPIPTPDTRSSVEAIVTSLQEEAWYKTQIVERRTYAAKAEKVAALNPPLSQPIATALLQFRNISALYTHQVQAISAIRDCKHVIVSTGTASGKSVVYQVPVLQALEQDLQSTAMFVYPTKALAQDQKAAMEQLLACCPSMSNVKAFTFDGDTPREARPEIRETASIVFTNFDTLHASILPHENLWRRFLKNLKIFAVDELHYYSGLMGSHIALVIRRLRRICAALGNRRIVFVSCSATISNPQAHMENVFGIPGNEIKTVTEDGAPTGSKDIVVWNPAFIDPLVPNLGRHSSLSDAVSLMKYLMKNGVRVILFCKIRKICELAMKTLRADLSNEGRFDILERTMPYRGGYTQKDRRRIEQQAFSGQLLGIVSTNALELGVDIGILDAVIMLGFPGTIASFKQQAGRAGRRSRDSLAVLVADSFAIDQHYAANPAYLFEERPADIQIDLDSRIILEAHLQCASHEMPISPEDEQYFGTLMHDICATRLVRDEEGWYHTHTKFLPYPSQYVSIRGPEEETYAVIDITKAGQESGSLRVLEEVEVSRAMFEVYEGGVFLHQGLTFIVKEVSHDERIAKVIRADVNWITSPRDFTDVDAVQVHRVKESTNASQRFFYGRIEVKVKVFGFFKIRNKQILDTVDLETPTWEHDTTGLWIDVPKSILHLFRSKGINAAEGVHSAEHAFLNQFPLAQDLKTECKAPEKEYMVTPTKRKRPARLIFYDTIGKGGGVAGKAFDNAYPLLRNALHVAESCECKEGCLKCVQSHLCRENNVVCSKLGALIILRSLLGMSIDEDAIPLQGPTDQDSSTVIEATAIAVTDGVRVEKES